MNTHYTEFTDMQFFMNEKTCLLNEHIYDELCVKILFCHDEILHFKDQNLGQILHVDKTCFLRPGHKYLSYVTKICFQKWPKFFVNKLFVNYPLYGTLFTDIHNY